MGTKSKRLRKNYTLDLYHKKKLREFNRNRNMIHSLRKKMETKKKNNKDEIKKKINKLKLDEMRYYLKVMDLLIKYYNKTSYIQNNTNDNNNNNTNNNNEKDLNFFINKETKIDKAAILNEYLYRLYNDTTNKRIKYMNDNNNSTMCYKCNIKKTLNLFTSTYICRKCGVCNFVFVEIGKVPYINEPVIEGNNFSYRRYDHFVEWLNKFQNNKKQTVPKQIYQIIFKELQKMRIDDVSKINKDMITEILKKTGNTKYNSQIYQIIHKINNKPIPKLPVKIQEKMKIMFKQIQKPFEKACPSERTNFLSYSYVICKFLGILGQHKYIKYFPLLKSREKLYYQDVIWKSMCNQLNWKYSPSI